MLSKLQTVKSLICLIEKLYAKMSLRSVLIMAFVLQTCGCLGLVGYLAHQQGQKVVTEFATQLENEICDRIEQYLNNYLTTPEKINQINADAIRLGLLNLSDLEATEHYFWKQKQIFNIGYNKFVNPKGEFVSIDKLDNRHLLTKKIPAKNHIDQLYVHTTNKQSNRSRVSKFKNYNPRVKYWYVDAVDIAQPVWSSIYQWKDKPEVLSLSSNHPIYDRTNKLIGVIGIDLLLSQISSFLDNLKVGKSGKIFILERSGLIVASSTTEPPYTNIKGQAKRLLAADSKDPVVRLTTQYLIKRFGSLGFLVGQQKLSFSTKQANYFVQVKNWRDELGLDWLIVVVISESDFVKQIHFHNSSTMMLCIATLLVAIQFGILTAHWVIKPILQLNVSAQKMAAGDWEQRVKIERFDELGKLAKSFNSMAKQMQKTFAALEAKHKVINRLQSQQKNLIKSQKAAEQANYAKSEFLANMSHELRTPLNAILGFAQLMGNDNSLSSEHQQNLAIINHAGEHLLNLINDILEMSKIEAGRTTLNVNSFDLLRLLASLEEMLRFRAVSQGLQLVFEYTPDLPQYVQTDEGKLRQVLLNLLGNAIKFTQIGSVTLRVRIEDGEIGGWVDGEAKPPHLCFEVLDTGPGIASEEIDLLFKAFGQTETGRKSQQGTGLGLAISRKYIQLMGGDITATSTVGEGSRFAFHIQISLGAASEIQTYQNQGYVMGLALEQAEYRILVVDDARDSRTLLVKLLTSVGFVVREASNGQEAIAQWLEWQPHLIFMDMRMPVMDGYEATKVIKAREIGYVKQSLCIIPPYPIIIALTASAFEEERQKILSIGCDDFIRKPFTQHLLLKKVNEHLGVKYINKVEPANIPTACQQTQTLPSEADLLRHLSQMPPEWLGQVRHAAASCSDGMILELLQEIPADKSQLFRLFRDLANNYQFEKIMELTRTNTE